ncbi:nucleotidyltransferase [Duganella sp. BJB488]|nr:nucleotidyltransferase [Duganella sp. BJB489]RFP17235.1 nucleotidyltransferase [Duganella sp. BJB488]RFP31706.1 nucleotidyltransferase [Duganella sp. BJB480]
MDQNVWARELDIVNRHITVDVELVQEASAAYLELGNDLVDKLGWPKDAIQVLPQGSTSTRTLISSPTTEKFDIDAVCQVDLNRIEAQDPMAFFDKVGDALAEHDTEEMKRCWRINYNNKEFYIDFTPSIPLAIVPDIVKASIRFKPTLRYNDTALAVVDRPTKGWKTSNPAGFANWINDQAQRRVLRQLQVTVEARDSANVTPVPEQHVPLSDTLRVAIRLFKRHRDMSVRRNLVSGEFKPISVIISTLLTQAYEGLADLGKTYNHPIELLCDLAQMLPSMPQMAGTDYVIANPTVEGENFAEKWNDDGGKRVLAFTLWSKLLIDDLTQILNATDLADVREKVHRAFGTTGADRGPGGSGSPVGGLAAARPSTVTPVRPTRGLA